MIDAHVYLWSEGLPRRDRLRKPATAATLLAALPQPVEGVVLVATNPTDALAETRRLAGAAAALPCPAVLIAHVPLTEPDALDQLTAQAAEAGVVGIRDVAAWRPDAARPHTGEPRRLESTAFRAAVGAAARLGFGLELTISSFQSEAAARLARDMPGLRLVVSHCGCPPDDGPEARALWRDGLERLAEHPNVAIKLCDPMAARAGGSRNWMLDVVAVCLDIFGPSRALYGSCWPAAPMPPAAWAGVVAEAVADLHPAAQARVWSGTARALYFSGPRLPLPAPGPGAV